MQALGGTGGLKIGADFLKRLKPGATVLISDPSWENHRALFTNAGFAVDTYPYYDAATRGIRFDAMLDALSSAAPGTVVVLHACCHNPTGCDLTPAQWDQIVAVCKARGLVPFLDMAYQGFGEGIAEDGAVIGQFLAAGIDFFVSTSFSKSFSLYGERVGALSVVCADKPTKPTRVLSQLKIVIRTNYSNPPTFGAQVVATVLTHAGAAPAVGRGTGRHARAHPRDARTPWSPSCRPPACTQRPVATSRGRRACSATPACRRPRCSACAANSASTASIPAASAWRRINSRNIDAVVAALAKVM